MRRTIALLALGFLYPFILAAQSQFAGIYMGGYVGSSTGDVVIVVRTNDTAIIWGHDNPRDQGKRAIGTNDSDGTFSGVVGDYYLQGKATSSGVSGQGQDIYGQGTYIAFNAPKKPSTGTTAHFYGHYRGFVVVSPSLTNYLEAVAAGDGSFWMFSQLGTNADGGFGSLAGNGTFSANGIDGSSYSGKINETNFVMLGNMSGAYSKEIAIARFMSLRPNPPMNEYDPTLSGFRGPTLTNAIPSHLGRSYSLNRSADLLNWTILEMKRGTGNELKFTQGMTASNLFYRFDVRE